MASVEQYQAYGLTHDGDISSLMPIGQPVHSEAAAWQAVFTMAWYRYPDNVGRRWIFIDTCEVKPVVRVEIH